MRVIILHILSAADQQHLSGRENGMDARLTAINRKETLQYLGYRGSLIPPVLEADIDRCEKQILCAARPRCIWKLFDLLQDVRLSGTDFTPQGQDVPALLKNCSQVILMAATLGSEVEMLLRRSQVNSMGDAVILDAAASAAIENVCDNLCDDLSRQFEPRFLTDRFSPGYGDFPFSQQRMFFDLLDITRQIGVSLSGSGLMLPQKSVTALVGISDFPQPHRHRGCSGCALFETCAFRKEGTHCGAV
jgi:hypothetical protein